MKVCIACDLLVFQNNFYIIILLRMKKIILEKPKWYKVEYKVNWEVMNDVFSCITIWEPIYEINSELDDRYFWEDWEVIKIKPIKTPKEYCF